MQLSIKNTLFYDKIKDFAHQLPFIPYRKPSKRYKIWNKKKEAKFLQAINEFYKADKQKISDVEVSVIMPVYNRAYCINDAIESVVNQTHNNWKLLIIDDGSTDNLEEKIQKYLQDDRIKLFKTEHQGVAKARNIGLDNASGKYVFYLDTDNIWFSAYLRTMITFMEAGDLEAAYSGSIIINDEQQTIGYFGEDFAWKDCWELNYVDINSFAHKKEITDKGLRFDESLKRLVDWDLILHLTSYSRTAYAPFIGVQYYDGQKGGRITFTEYQGVEITAIINQIQSKYYNIINKKYSDVLRPRWQNIIRNKTK